MCLLPSWGVLWNPTWLVWIINNNGFAHTKSTFCLFHKTIMRRHIFVDSCSNNGVISMPTFKFSCRIIQSRCFIMIKPHFCILIFFSNTNLRIYFPLWIHLNASPHTISYIGTLGIDFKIFQMLQYFSILIVSYVVDYITCFNPSTTCIACIVNNTFRE